MALRRLRQVANTASALRRIHRAGGPKSVKLVRVDHPKGLFLTSSTAIVHVDTRSGKPVEFETALPVPFVYAWAYRLARRLGVPFASDIDPEDVSFRFPVPGWAWPGGGAERG
jgi:hypothetical protein